MSRLTDERIPTHGEFHKTAQIAQAIKRVVTDQIQLWDAKLTAHQREGLSMACSKMARIISGDPGFPDHWVDLFEYLALADPEALS